jgi:hypothetical protein
MRRRDTNYTNSHEGLGQLVQIREISVSIVTFGEFPCII